MWIRPVENSLSSTGVGSADGPPRVRAWCPTTVRRMAMNDEIDQAMSLIGPADLGS
jgi:hypothetical protein